MIGKTLGGRYTITEGIDSGGMAYIYKAICQKSGNTVALKVLKEEFAGKKEYVDRFKREAQAVFSLEHKNIVRIYDVGYDEKVYYMVMEFIDGPTLKNVVETSGFLPEKQAIEYALQICSALQSAHKHNIIHRDIKPQNILIDKDENVKVTDFGIAKSAASKYERSTEVIGSVYYVSPEQAKGEKVDHRSDIYSLGIVLYEMVTGELPYTGDKSISVALKHINEQITPPINKNSEISMSINNIIIKATSKVKYDRYNDIAELKKDLMLALTDKDGKFVQVPSSAARIFRQINFRKNNIWKSVVIAATLALLVAAGIFGGTALFGTGKARIDEEHLGVPNLVGMNLSEAKNILKTSGLNIIVVYESSLDYVTETIISQSPEPGSNLMTEDSIMLTVSAGPVILYMPNLIGTAESDAVQMIEDMGLSIESVTYETEENFVPGTVISQVPEADSDILENTAVSLVISNPETGVMPHVINKTLDQAVELLNKSGFKNTFVYQEDSVREPGVVISQSPEQGENVEFTRDVDLHISMLKNLKFEGQIDEEIKITDVASKLKIVLVEQAGSYITYFVVREPLVQPGSYDIRLSLNSNRGGVKKVIVFINKLPSYVFEVYFYERSESE